MVGYSTDVIKENILIETRRHRVSSPCSPAAHHLLPLPLPPSVLLLEPINEVSKLIKFNIKKAYIHKRRINRVWALL